MFIKMCILINSITMIFCALSANNNRKLLKAMQRCNGGCAQSNKRVDHIA